MRDLDKIFHPKYSQNSEYDPFFEYDYFQDIETDEEINESLHTTDLDETFYSLISSIKYIELV
jgi:hypothetical protein